MSSLHDQGFLGPIGAEAHGSRACFAAGCRCTPCRAAESCYQGMRRRARANGHGDPRGWVDAGPCRAHVATLQAAGLGLRQVARLAGLAFSVIQGIQKGQARVTPETEAAILRVRPILAGGVVVNAYRAFDRIRLLVKEGYTHEQLRAWLGFDLTRRYKGVTVRKASRVKALFDRLTAG